MFTHTPGMRFGSLRPARNRPPYGTILSFGMEAEIAVVRPNVSADTFTGVEIPLAFDCLTAAF